MDSKSLCLSFLVNLLSYWGGFQISSPKSKSIHPNATWAPCSLVHCSYSVTQIHRIMIMIMMQFTSVVKRVLTYMVSQILPPKIKGLAGSVATLANWFCSWIITMTAPLLLAWSSGGSYLCIFSCTYLSPIAITRIPVYVVLDNLRL